MVSDPLAAVLRSGRDLFNARFAEARRLFPDLDGQAFAAFVEAAVDPLARATRDTRPERVADVVMAAYDLGLELCGQRLAGAPSVGRWIEEGWRDLGSAAAALVAFIPVAGITTYSTSGSEAAGFTAGAASGDMPINGDMFSALLTVGFFGLVSYYRRYGGLSRDRQVANRG